MDTEIWMKAEWKSVGLLWKPNLNNKQKKGVFLLATMLNL